MPAPTLPALGAFMHLVVITLPGALSASVADIIKFPAPFDCTLLYATACAQAKGGTQGTSTVTLLNAGQAMTDAMDLGTPAAKAVVEAVPVAAQQLIAKNAPITGDLVISGGSAPTLSYITVLMVLQRRG